MAAAAEEIGAAGDAEVVVLSVAVLGPAVVRIELDAIQLVVQEDVHHARDGAGGDAEPKGDRAERAGLERSIERGFIRGPPS